LLLDAVRLVDEDAVEVRGPLFQVYCVSLVVVDGETCNENIAGVEDVYL
jgi:hypothetical protein